MAKSYIDLPEYSGKYERYRSYGHSRLIAFILSCPLWLLSTIVAVAAGLIMAVSFNLLLPHG